MIRALMLVLAVAASPGLAPGQQPQLPGITTERLIEYREAGGTIYLMGVIDGAIHAELAAMLAMGTREIPPVLTGLFECRDQESSSMYQRFSAYAEGVPLTERRTEKAAGRILTWIIAGCPSSR